MSDSSRERNGTYTINYDPTSFYYPYYVLDALGRWVFVGQREKNISAKEQCHNWIDRQVNP